MHDFAGFTTVLQFYKYNNKNFFTICYGQGEVQMITRLGNEW